MESFLWWCKVKWRALMIILVFGFLGVLSVWMSVSWEIYWLACIGGLLLTVAAVNIIMNLILGTEY